MDKIDLHQGMTLPQVFYAEWKRYKVLPLPLRSVQIFVPYAITATVPPKRKIPK